MTRFSLILIATVIYGSAACADEPPVDFNREIRPILFDNCITCHGPDEEERAAGLRLDDAESAVEDLGGYAAIVPGDADASEIIARITSEDEDVRMPPPDYGAGLSGEDIGLMRRWINQGAQYAKHWSYEPPRFDGLPNVADNEWPTNAIDYFVLARLEAMGLQPSEAADRLTLARRVALDLTGLPPTWQEAQDFAADRGPAAYERYVDAQLEKPAFGERWARVWLDLARYADSAGYADDPPRTIWAFRDYVVRSLNENKPFDRFTVEQIAGDLLANASEEQLVATAFHRNTLTNNEGGTNDEEFRNVAIVDRVNTTMAVWMGTTMACAQCHTHKYDPITQEEYFRFFALLNSTADADKRDESPTLELFSEDQKTRRTQIESRIDELRRTLQTQTPALDAALADWIAGLGGEPVWTAQIPERVDSPDRTLKVDDKGWIAADDRKPERTRYTIRIPTSDATITSLMLEIPETQDRNFVITNLSARWQSADQSAARAKYVRVTVPGKDKILHVAEIQAFSNGVNVASAGMATQSSLDYDGPAKRVIDGNTDGEFSNQSVNHTNKEASPWVEVDLGKEAPIDRVVVWNRTDGGKSIMSRLDGFNVQLLSESREVVWENTPVARAQASYSMGIESRVIEFAAALADHEQSGFPASAVLTASPKEGWAVAPQIGKPHRLTLILKRPLEVGRGTLVLELKHDSEHAKHLLDHFRILATDDDKVATWGKLPDRVRGLVKVDAEQWNLDDRVAVQRYHRSITPLLKDARKELGKLEKQRAGLKPMTTVPIMRELTDRRQTHIQLRGNYQSKGDEVTRGTPAVFHPISGGDDPTRLDLAKWLIDPANPLTARVIANRHWEQLFGVGIVETSEEFGSQGELPSHPELLDWLAIELQSSGWDLKHLIKTIVMSATYRQRSVADDGLLSADPYNRWLSRGPRFRISAEMVRDQALFVSGLLSRKMYGPPVKPMQPELGLKAAFGSATDWQTSKGDDRYRRGLYTTWRRSSPYPSMAQFDAPNREVCTVRRIRTNTPLQALVTLNDPVYVEAAQALARKMIGHASEPAGRIRYAFRHALIREPNEEETARLIDLANEAVAAFNDEPDEAAKMATDPLGDLPDDADVIDHAAWTVIANVILNLDEMLMKR